MKNKGFTLMELLAVMTILAIIILIIVPIITNIIDDSRLESYKRSIDLYGKSIEQAIQTAEMENSREKLSCEDYETIIKNVKYSGNKVKCKISINKDKSIYMKECTVNDKEVKNYTYGTEKEEYLCLINQL